MRSEPKGYGRTCRHCGQRYEYFPDYDPKEANNFCSPECDNCENTKRDEYWAAPCYQHKAEAEKRNGVFLSKQGEPHDNR